jgi:hypothetical protein
MEGNEGGRLLFSLYPGDLIKIESDKDIVFSLHKDAKGEKQINRKECLFYIYWYKYQ